MWFDVGFKTYTTATALSRKPTSLWFDVGFKTYTTGHVFVINTPGLWFDVGFKTYTTLLRQTSFDKIITLSYRLDGRKKMKKETKNATIRLPESLADWLTKDGLSINQAIIEAAEDLRASKMAAMSELRGVFTTNEWCFFADSFGSTITPKAMRYNVQTILAQIEESCLYDHLDERWGVEADSLKDKIKHLHAANIEAIYSRLDKLQASDLDINVWAKY